MDNRPLFNALEADVSGGFEHPEGCRARVPGAGIEPTTTAFGTQDFKSCASASSATPACRARVYRINNDFRGLRRGIGVCIRPIVPAFCPSVFTVEGRSTPADRPRCAAKARSRSTGRCRASPTRASDLRHGTRQME